MRRALALAERGWGRVSPNPLVGAVVVRGGEIVGEGYHEAYGGAHAEPNALRAAGDRARGATIYVTLEPCNHHGKTPPCTEAILAAGIARVVFATGDPNPVAAGGAQRLRAAGIPTTGGVLARDASEVNAPFLFAASGADRPFVTLKLATSVDGAIAYRSREQRWLTGAAARRETHRLRAGADAVAVGAGTAASDDPSLTVREHAPPRIAPTRVVFDRQATLSPTSALVRTAGSVPVLVVTDGTNAEAERMLTGRGVDILRVPSLGVALQALRARGIRHLFVEGGASLASALADMGAVDRLIIFQAPVILGADGLPAFASWTRDALARHGHRGALRVVRRQLLDDDLMTVFRFATD